MSTGGLCEKQPADPENCTSEAMDVVWVLCEAEVLETVGERTRGVSPAAAGEPSALAAAEPDCVRLRSLDLWLHFMEPKSLSRPASP